jgi:hypothetical protein
MGLKDGHSFLIPDGVVNLSRYRLAWPKMLWILKEPYNDSKGGEVGGDWSLTDMLNEGKYNDKSPYAPIAYITHSVFSGFKPYKKLPSVARDEDVRKSVKNIASINVSKFPGKSQSNTRPLKEAYAKYKELLFRQIELFDPNIIIFGGTISLFKSDLHLEGKFGKRESAHYLKSNGKLYIQANHPSQRNTVDKLLYVNDIVKIVKDYCAERSPSTRTAS